MGLDMSINDAAHQEIRYVVLLDREIIYWRKANAVHRWFCEHLIKPPSNCEHVPVSASELTQLLTTCWQIQSSPDQANELMPVQEGFFFGSTSYDEWYHDQVENTIHGVLDALVYINATPSAALYYEANW